MATNHVGFERQTDHSDRKPLDGGGDASGHGPSGLPAPSDQERRGPLLKIGKGTLFAYLGGAVVLSALFSLAAAMLPAPVTGVLLLCSLVAVGWFTFVRRAPWNGDGVKVDHLKQELDVSRRQYRRLFSAVPDFICVLDRQHNIVEANDAYRLAFGADTNSLCYEVCKRRTSECPHCVVDATFSDGVPRTEEEILITRDGRRINALVHTQAIFDEDLNINAVMEVFTDVTEVKRLQRQLALTGRAVAGTAHRIKNILMGLEGGIFIVNDGLESDDRHTITSGWEMVERNVHRVAAIVKDLLFCAKERKPEFERNVCPQEILLEVHDLFADRMKGREHRDPRRGSLAPPSRDVRPRIHPQSAVQSGRQCH